jgi:CBS domain-containing protein
MRKHDIGAVPIGEEDQLIGMVTDRDIVCKGLAENGFDVRRATAREVMTPGSIAVGRTMTSPRRYGTWKS